MALDIVDAASPSIRAAAAAVTGEVAYPAERARSLFEFVRDRIAYAFIPPDFERGGWDAASFQASHTLARGTGMCLQKAILLCALARAVGLGARVVLQAIRDHRLPRELVRLMGTDILRPHGLVSLQLDGRWIRLDPSLDRRLCEEKMYRLVEFSGVEHALLPRHDLRGRPHIDIVEEIGEYDEFPLSLVSAIFAERRRLVDHAAILGYVRSRHATM